jgi:RND family efflux transporter MFP subunit
MDGGKTKLLRSLSIERTAPSGRQPRQLPVLALVSVAALLALAATLWSVNASGPGAAAQPTPPAPAISATVLASQPRAGALIASGYVVARRRATIASELTGKIEDVLVDEGMVVKAGHLLARLDSVLAEKDLALAKSRADAAEAAIEATAADLRDAERIFNRTQSLSQKNFASEADLTKNEARMAVLRAQLRQAQAQLETARLDAKRNAAVLEKHAIRAPFAGIVVQVSAQPGEMISPMSAGGSFTRTGICTIVDMDSIEIEVDVNEAFIGRIHSGGGIDAVLDAYPDWTIPGAVIAIVPTANREKAAVRVRVGLNQKDPRILPDMAVKVTFLEDGPTAWTETSRPN